MQKDVRAYQLHLIAQNCWSQINQTACALRFFYGVTLGRQEAFERIVQRPRAGNAPTRSDTGGDRAVLEAVAGLRNRVALTIDSKRMLIHVEGGKDAKDRYAMLSPRLLDILRVYWQRAHPGLWLFPGREPGDHVSIAPLQDTTRSDLDV
jgi:integrase/recombinase XerD